MLKNVQQDFDKRAQGFANWLNLVLYLNQDFYEIALVGPDFKTMGQTIGAIYIPNSILAGSVSESNLELLQNREVPGKTLAYVCIEGACKLPVSTTKDVLEQILTRLSTKQKPL
jgi:uncharacterized protein YyaL (SSP411 family)